MLVYIWWSIYYCLPFKYVGDALKETMPETVCLNYCLGQQLIVNLYESITSFQNIVVEM